ITVKRLGDITGPASVRYSTGAGTATEGADYLAGFGTITFGPLENSKTFKMPVLDDGIPETDETVSLLLSDAVGVALISLPEAKLRIIDDERPGSIDLS